MSRAETIAPWFYRVTTQREESPRRRPRRDDLRAARAPAMRDGAVTSARSDRSGWPGGVWCSAKRSVWIRMTDTVVQIVDGRRTSRHCPVGRRSTKGVRDVALGSKMRRWRRRPRCSRNSRSRRHGVAMAIATRRICMLSERQSFLDLSHLNIVRRSPRSQAPVLTRTQRCRRRSVQLSKFVFDLRQHHLPVVPCEPRTSLLVFVPIPLIDLGEHGMRSLRAVGTPAAPSAAEELIESSRFVLLLRRDVEKCLVVVEESPPSGVRQYQPAVIETYTEPKHRRPVIVVPT